MKLASGLSMKINSKNSYSGLLTKHKALAPCNQGEGFLLPKADHRAFRELGFIWSHVRNHIQRTVASFWFSLHLSKSKKAIKPDMRKVSIFQDSKCFTTNEKVYSFQAVSRAAMFGSV